MSTTDDLLRSPLTPDSVKETLIWTFENADFDSEADVNALITRMFNCSEDSFYLYTKEGTSVNALVNNSLYLRVIRIIESQAFYYLHPNSKRDYVRIQEGNIDWEWERIVKDQGPMFIRHELKLSEKGKRELELQLFLEHQKAARAAEDGNPLKLEPNFMGFGIDLRKAFVWLKKRLRK